MWSAASGPITVRVSVATFSYDFVREGQGQPWMVNGTIGFHCSNRTFSLLDGSLVPITNSSVSHGTEGGLAFHAISRSWAAGSCAQFTTTVRSFPATQAIEFLTDLGAGANWTATTAVATRKLYRGRHLPCNASSQFPSVLLPHGNAWTSWDGDFLFGPAVHSADVRRDWLGGLAGGPLVLLNNLTSEHPTALVVGACASFKDSVLVNVAGRLVAGHQGMLSHLPAGRGTRFALIARKGVTAAMVAFGAHLQRARAQTRRRLTLVEDVLSSRLHYVTDGGSLLNYCDYWPRCVNDTIGGCIPMHDTLEDVRAYHVGLGLGVSLYHLDPFWWSQEPSGGCKLGAFAQALDASPFHFPQGLGAAQLPMQLIFKWFTADNIYAHKYTFEGNSVGGNDAAHFWHTQLTRLVDTAGLRALVWDGLDYTWFSSDVRLDTPGEQRRADSGLADAAAQLGLPMRVDTSVPSDALGSVEYPAYVAQRVTGDANPHDYFEAHNWLEYAQAAVLPTAVGVRPMLDVLWTTPSQPADPRWRGCTRKNIRHDLILAVLSTGPVGFGDLVGGTDAALLGRASRADGLILKPAFPVLRIDRWYSAAGGAEVWAAVAGPAGGTDPREDARANSMAHMAAASADPLALWWWQVLATNVDGATIAGRPLALSELWPTPRPSTVLLVAVVDKHVGGDGDGAGPPEGSTRCEHGAKAATCLSLWTAGVPLDVSTSPPDGLYRSFALLAAAPVLASGWTLLGELGGVVVPVSPQRFVAVGGGEAPHEQDLQWAAGGLHVSVLGVHGETVDVTLVAPPADNHATDSAPGSSHALNGMVLVLSVPIGATGRAEVRCEGRGNAATCEAQAAWHD